MPVAEDANAILAKYSRAPVFILEDYNSCRLDNVRLSYQLYVDISARRENIPTTQYLFFYFINKIVGFKQ